MRKNNVNFEKSQGVEHFQSKHFDLEHFKNKLFVVEPYQMIIIITSI